MFFFKELFSAPFTYLFSFNHSWQGAFLPPQPTVRRWQEVCKSKNGLPGAVCHNGGPGCWRPSGHATSYHRGSRISGLFWRRSNKSVLVACPSAPGGSGVKPLLTAVVEGGNHTCPDFLRGSKSSRARFREVLELSKPTFHPVRKSPEQLPAAFGGHLRWGCHRELLIYYPQYTAAHIWCNFVSCWVKGKSNLSLTDDSERIAHSEGPAEGNSGCFRHRATK